MADTFARMRQLIGTPAEWAANDIVLGYGEIGVERDPWKSVKVKVGDGTSKWSLLPYLSADETVINSATQAALAAKLPLSGGTMTGSIILAHDGVLPREPATTAQVTAAAKVAQTAVDTKVSRSGDTMTGPLIMARDGSDPKEPATTAQVTNAVSVRVSRSGDTMTGPLVMAQDAVNPLEPATLQQLNASIAKFASSFGNISYAGSIDPTKAYAAIIPAPVSGSMYTSSASGAFNPTWASYVAGAPPSTVSAGDQFIYSLVDGKLHFVPVNSSVGGAFVPLAGTSAMVGKIEWAGPPNSLAGAVLIAGKGGSITDCIIKGGTY